MKRRGDLVQLLFVLPSEEELAYRFQKMRQKLLLLHKAKGRYFGKLCRVMGKYPAAGKTVPELGRI